MAIMLFIYDSKAIINILRKLQSLQKFNNLLGDIKKTWGLIYKIRGTDVAQCSVHLSNIFS